MTHTSRQHKPDAQFYTGAIAACLADGSFEALSASMGILAIAERAGTADGPTYGAAMQAQVLVLVEVLPFSTKLRDTPGSTLVSSLVQVIAPFAYSIKGLPLGGRVACLFPGVFFVFSTIYRLRPRVVR